MSMFERCSFPSDPSRFALGVTSLASRDNHDVAKRGYLYVKRPPTNSTVKLRLQAWQKRYLVLRDALTATDDTTLELHSCEPPRKMVGAASFSSFEDISSVGVTSRRQQTGGWRPFVISLRKVDKVEIYLDSKRFQNAFIVNRSGMSPLIFGAKNDMEMREWMMAIQMLANKLRPQSLVRDVMQTDATPQATAAAVSTTPTPPVPPRRRLEQLSAQPGAGRRAYNDVAMRRSTPVLMTTSPPKRGATSYTPRIDNDRLSSASSSGPPDEAEKLFAVRMQHYSDSSMPRRLRGDFYLVVSHLDISLRHCRTTGSTDDVCNDHDDDDVIVRWLLHRIRKLKCESCDDGFGDVITLVAMSDSPVHSDALYQFRTGCGPDIIRFVRQLVRKLNLNSTTTTSNHSLTSSHFVNGSAKSIEGGMSSELVCRSQPDMLSSRSENLLDGCSNSSTPPTARIMPRRVSDFGATEKAFYLPLVDSKDEYESPVDETDQDQLSSSFVGSVVTAEAASYFHRQTSASRSTEVLTSAATFHSYKQVATPSYGSAELLSHGGAPLPPPRPVHSLSIDAFR